MSIRLFCNEINNRLLRWLFLFRKFYVMVSSVFPFYIEHNVLNINTWHDIIQKPCKLHKIAIQLQESTKATEWLSHFLILCLINYTILRIEPNSEKCFIFVGVPEHLWDERKLYCRITTSPIFEHIALVQKSQQNKVQFYEIIDFVEKINFRQRAGSISIVFFIHRFCVEELLEKHWFYTASEIFAIVPHLATTTIIPVFEWQ